VLLRRAVGDVGIDPDDLYITNAVKHFKFRRQGKRRIHQTPDRIEIVACRPWLLAEFAQLNPRVVVVLGATAAQALLGPSFRVTKQRGELLPWPESAWHPEDFAQPGGSAKVMATLHPSAVLRADDRDTAYQGLVADLQVAASVLR
jgi:DNA polymerase